MPKLDKLEMAAERARWQKPKSEGGNITPWNEEQAREAQKKSIESRKRNKAMREEMKQFVKTLDDIGADIAASSPNSLDVMKMLMVKAIHDGNDAKAMEYAAAIAPYENAKLQSINQEIVTRDTKELSEEELRELAELEKGDDDDLE